MGKKKKTILDLIEMKKRGEKFVTAVCYDYPWAKLVDATEIETIFCGDSLGMNVYGYSGTQPVTMEQMIFHCQAVRRGATNTFMFGDMVYGSYETSPSDAVRNGIRLIKETGCDAVKLEGGVQFAPHVKAMTDAGIVVFGHLGITPQSSAMIGGFKTQGRDVDSGKKIIEDSFALYEAGAKSILLECVPEPLGNFIASKLPIPIQEYDQSGTLLCDMFGMFFEAKPPRFAYRSKYVFSDMILETLKEYNEEVKAGRFPRPENRYTVKGAEEDYIKIFESYKDVDYL